MATVHHIELIPMDFHGQEVGYLLDKEGNPWWHAQQPCVILGYGASDVYKVMQRLDEDERRKFVILRSSKMAVEQWCVNESGLYSLILGSHKEEAKVFKRWITHEVLPAIRATGAYTLTPAKLNAHFLGPQPLAIDPDHTKFELEFFQAVCQVFGQRVPTDDKHSPMCAWFIRKYIYGAMPPTVFAEMDRLNPVVDKRSGRRKLRLWQLLKLERIGDFLLKRIHDVHTILRTCLALGKATFQGLMAEHDRQNPLKVEVPVAPQLTLTLHCPIQPLLPGFVA